MTSITKFDLEIYSEEIYGVTEEEYDEVMTASAVEDGGWRGYTEGAGQLEETERAAALEQYAFEREQERLGTVTINGARVLIKRECNHAQCKSSQCERGLRIGGLEI